MATIKDVAREAGVAYSTASIAMRGVGKVAPATRERVLRVAQLLGYRANAAASVLAGGRNYRRETSRGLQVAYLSTSARAPSVRPDSLLRGVESECERLGYGLQTISFTQLQRKGAADRLWHRGVEGLIIGETHGPALEPFAFPWHRFAVVKIRRILPWLSVDMVRASAPEMIFKGLNAIIERGYRSILCLLMPTPSRLDDDLRVGAVYAYQQRHLPEGVRLSWAEFTPAEECPNAEQELHRHMSAHHPDVVLGFSTAFYHALQRSGYAVPQDVAYAGFPIFREEQPPDAKRQFFAGIDANIGEQGAMAMRHLHDLLRTGSKGEKETPAQYLLETNWIDGATLPC